MVGAPRRPRAAPDGRSELTAADAYRAARLVALAGPARGGEEEVAARRLRALLALDGTSAAAQARRCALLQRDRRLHETLVLDAAPEVLGPLLDAVPVDGEIRRRTLLVALHYGPYSSLLWLALARVCATAGLPLAILVDRALDPNLVLGERRLGELDAAGVVRRDAFTAHDAAAGRSAAVRRVAAELRDGGAVLVFADAWFGDPRDPRALRARLGARTLAFPRGIAWLAARTRCRVAAAAIRPHGDGHRVTVEEAPGAPAALAHLLRGVEAEPAPWEGWLRRGRDADRAFGYH